MSIVIDEDVYLEHFGVKGMHWGIRKEERRVQKSRKYALKAQAFQTKISELDTLKPKTRFGQNRIAKERSELVQKRNQAIEDAQRKREGKLTDKQRAAAIGAGVVAAAVAAKVTYNAIQSGEARRLTVNGKNFLFHRGESKWKPKPELSEAMDADGIMNKIVGRINPGYGEAGTKVNCRRCTFAYEMRRRGFDVSATRTTNGRGQDASGVFNALTPGQKNFVNPGRGGMAARVFSEAFKTRKGGEAPFSKAVEDLGGAHGLGKIKVDPGSIFDALTKQPNGARGELGVIWSGGGGHSMAWEVIDGKGHIFDTQTGIKYSSMKDLKEGLPEISTSALTRLDNVEFNDDFLGRWIKNA